MNKSDCEFVEMLRASGLDPIDIAEITDTMAHCTIEVEMGIEPVAVNTPSVYYEDDIPNKIKYAEKWKSHVAKTKK